MPIDATEDEAGGDEVGDNDGKEEKEMGFAGEFNFDAAPLFPGKVIFIFLVLHKLRVFFI